MMDENLMTSSTIRKIPDDLWDEIWDIMPSSSMCLASRETIEYNPSDYGEDIIPEFLTYPSFVAL
jgi:hypothetical protein